MISDYYTSTVTPYTRTSSSDGMGGEDETYTVGTAFSGRIRMLSGSEQIIDESRRAVTTHVLYCSSDNTVTNTMRLAIGGVTYEVINVDTKQDASSNHHYEVSLRRVS